MDVTEELMSRPHVLVVDLDGSLIHTDLLYESFWSALASDFKGACLALMRLARGRAALKSGLARCVKLDVARLPYNEAVLGVIRQWRANGGRTALCTASHEGFAHQVAEHLDLFDEVHGSHETRNLKGRSKAAFLAERYGAGNYDYIGDSPADLPVWRNARRAISVGASERMRRSVGAAVRDVEHLDGRTPAGPAVYLKALRPHQWAKNVLVFLPVLAAHDASPRAWIASFLAFAAFSLVASSVYVLNDLLDLASDRAHPRKRRRPFASGEIPLNHGTAMAPALLLLGVLLGLAVGRVEFLAVLLGYYALTTAYSVFLKRRLVIDVCTLAGLYTARIIAGSVATGLSPSVWLLAFSIFFFLSLAAVKRQAELVDGLAAGRARASGRAYHVDDLPIVAMMAIAAGYISVLVLALYINSSTVQMLYGRPAILWGVCPLLLYWVSRMVMIAHRGGMDDDPIVFAVRDRVSQITGLLVLGFALAGSLL